MPPLFQALSWGPKVGDLDQGDKDWLRRDSAMPKAGKPSRPMCRRKTSHDKRERGLGTMASLQTGTYGEERSTERAKMWGCHRALGNTVREEKETERRSGSWPGPHPRRSLDFIPRGDSRATGGLVWSLATVWGQRWQSKKGCLRGATPVASEAVQASDRRRAGPEQLQWR